MPRLLVLVSIALVACTGQTPTGSAGGTASATAPRAAVASAAPSGGRLTSGAPPAPPTAWEQATSSVGSDGTVSLRMAIQAFSLAVGPIPGGDLTPTSAGLGDIPDGGGAVRWLLGHWDELTPGQREAASAYLEGSPSSTPLGEVSADGVVLIGSAPPVTAVTEVAAASAVPAPAELLAVITKARTTIEGHVGPLGIPIRVFLNTVEVPVGGNPALAYAEGRNDVGGTTGATQRCVIHVNPSAMAGGLGADAKAVLAHETFHCFQAKWIGLDRYYSKVLAPWIVEGSAAWAGEEVAVEAFGSASSLISPRWVAYFSTPGTLLTTRTYDAIGFYAELKVAGIDPWKRNAKMLMAADNLAAYNEAGASDPAFEDRWAPSLFRNARLGDKWDTDGPGIPPSDRARAPLVPLDLPEGVTETLRADSFANATYVIKAAAPIVEARVLGHAWLADLSFEPAPLADAHFCTGGNVDACACPKGEDYTGPPLSPITLEAAVALTGGRDGAIGIIRGVPMSEVCNKKATPAGSGNNGGGGPGGAPGSSGGGSPGSSGGPEDCFRYKGECVIH